MILSARSRTQSRNGLSDRQSLACRQTGHARHDVDIGTSGASTVCTEYTLKLYKSAKQKKQEAKGQRESGSVCWGRGTSPSGTHHGQEVGDGHADAMVAVRHTQVVLDVGQEGVGALAAQGGIPGHPRFGVVTVDGGSRSRGGNGGLGVTVLAAEFFADRTLVPARLSSERDGFHGCTVWYIRHALNAAHPEGDAHFSVSMAKPSPALEKIADFGYENP
ncbi:hypothetical protein C0Q70_00335 [Pomacea canaliculata]|uniref:Uncharacterized protein n=1 Tax=Pomacea canaliculata TaxID=400727 RepID=A0A2T7PWC9_POMCA|nr:hypothetical protein C0Q70_00335 [Pomacea canaliculata]